MGIKTVAVVGLGARGHHTYAKYQHLFPERMKIVAIADTNPEKVELCKKELAVFSVPKEFEQLDRLPKTMIGKVDFKKLKEDSVKEMNIKNGKN